MKKFLLFISASLLIQVGAYAQSGSFAPNFIVTDIHGETHELYNYLDQGKYVVVEFFGTWCGPCQELAPEVAQGFVDFGCNYNEVIFISIDTGSDTQSCFDFDQEYMPGVNGLPIVSGIDGGGDVAHNSYGISGVPTIVTISPIDTTYIETHTGFYGVLSAAGIDAQYYETPCMSSDGEESDESEPNINVDTIFFYDCLNTLILPEENIEDFDINFVDFDEAIPAPYEGETLDVLNNLGSFFFTYDTNENGIPTEPNGDLTFDLDENTDPSVPDTAWYLSAYSWFTNISQADNWLGMGPITIPDEGAEFKFYYRGVSNWIDGFDLYVTTEGMEPYENIDPGYTDITYSIEGHYPQASPQDTVWTQHTVSLNDFAGESIYITFHHHDTDLERLMLDNFLITSNQITQGCTDIDASNFNPDAEEDDGSCEYYQAENITNTYLGSSYNMYTVLSPSTNPVHANNALGTISFTHRQNAELPGGSGVIQTSWSTDGGESWDYVLQPTNDETQFNRYPSGLILDPSGNNNLDSAHTVVAGPISDDGGWVSNYFYNFALDGSGGREFNLNDSDSEFPSFTRNSMMADKNNVVRVLGYDGDQGSELVVTTGEYNPNGENYYTDLTYASTVSYFYGEYLDEFEIQITPAAWGPAEPVNIGDTIFYMNSENYDLFSDGSIDSTWTNEVEIINNFDANGDSLASPDTLLVWSNIANIQDAEGNWIPTTFEYDSFYVELNGAIDSTLFEGTPGYYWTQQGVSSNGLVEFYDYSMAFNQNGDIGYVVHQGTDVNGQIVPFVHYTMNGGANWMQLSHDFSSIDGYIFPSYNGGIDCAVDKYGNLHIICSVYEGDESIEEENRKVYDILVNQNGWSANYISDINTERVLDTDPMAIHGVGYNHRIQAARSEDGSKVFAVWTDVNIEEFGEMEKLEYPDIYAYGIDVDQGLNTLVKNFTKYTSIEGYCYWMFTSPIALNVEGGYMLPTTRSEAGNASLDPMEHFYVNGIGFAYDDFIYQGDLLFGCTDPNYLEFDPNANEDDGSCAELIAYGCNNPWAINYNNEANLDDGSCIYEIYNGDGFVTSDCSMLGDFETQVNISNDQITFNFLGESIIFPIIHADGPNLELQSDTFLVILQDDIFLEIMFSSPIIAGSILYSSIGLNIDLFGSEYCNIEIDLGINPYFGCTDNNAFNYNPWANIDDGNCLNYPQYDCNGNWYQSYQQEWIGSGDCQSGFPNFNCEEFDFDGGDCLNGCTDESACNFDVWANADNGTCIYPGENEFLEYVNTYFSQGTDLFSQGTDLFSQGSDMFSQGSDLFSQGTNLLSNFWDVLSFNEPEYSDHDSLEYLFETYSFYEMITGYNGEPIDVIVYDTVYVGPSIYLQGTNLFTQGTNLFYNGIESLFETIVDQIYSIFWDYETEGVFDCDGCVNDMNNNNICDEFEAACPYPEFIEYSDNAPLYDVESCETFIVFGCMNEWAYNFNPDATVNDGSCQGCTDELAYNYSPLIDIENNSYCEYVGCVNPMAENYNSQANIDDGSCMVFGCTLYMYPNYNPEATIDDGSCSMNSNDIYGCMDSQALNYNIEATIDNGGCEYPIGCPLPENWQYETTGTNHSMMIPEGIAIDVNGQPLTMGSSLGVFYHNENGELQCAGYTQINGEQTFIAIMGDDSTTDEIDGLQVGQELIWMVWDILTCAQYELDPSYSVGPSTFTVNGLTFLDALEHYTCQQIELPGGWFMYSSYVQTEDMDAELVMSSIVDNLIILKDNGGNAYIPEWTFNGIGELDFHYGYQIKTNTSETLEICGLQMQPEDEPIALQSGWNIVSYLRESPSPADEVFADFNTNDNLEMVKDYNGSPYLPEWDFNGIGNMYPGQGYQLKIYEADTLIYLSNDEQYRISTSEVIENSTDYFAKVNPTGNNMHIVIPQDTWDIIPEIGSEIAAYNSDGLLVGSAKYSNPTTVLTLWGDDKTTETIDGLLIDEPVLFKVWDKEQISDYKIENWSVGSNTYQVDEIHVAAAIEIEDFTQTTNLFDAIPNPSQTKTKISFFIAETQRVNISVYNVVGELVEVLANSEYNPGTHQLEMQVSNIEAGSYFYTMRAGDFEKTKQLIILK